MTRDEADRWGRDKKGERVDVPAAVLALVVERLGARRCVDCARLGIVTPETVPLEVDHVRALARGGDHHHTNLTLRCRSHNRAKAARPATTPPKAPAWERRRRWTR